MLWITLKICFQSGEDKALAVTLQPVMPIIVAPSYWAQGGEKLRQWTQPMDISGIVRQGMMGGFVGCSQAGLGASPAFRVPEYELQSMFELPLVLVLGALCGIASSAFKASSQVTHHPHAHSPHIATRAAADMAFVPAPGSAEPSAQSSMVYHRSATGPSDGWRMHPRVSSACRHSMSCGLFWAALPQVPAPCQHPVNLD